MPNIINITLQSRWQTLNDYISADAFNKLKRDILNIAESRGMLQKRECFNENGDGYKYINTLTQEELVVPKDIIV